MNKQGNLNEFLDISAGSGTHAPRQSRAYQSKRLQQVISDFRKRQKSGSAPPYSSADTLIQEDRSDGSGSGDGNPPPVKKQKTTTTSSKGKGKSKATPAANARQTKTTTSARGSKGSRRGGARGRKGKTVDVNEDSSAGSGNELDDASVPADDDDVVAREVALNLRPRIRPRPIPQGGRVAESSLGSTNINDDQALYDSSAG